MADTEVKSCEECGANIYPEHVRTHKAGVWGGKLLCAMCYRGHQQSQVTIDPNEFANPSAVAASRPMEEHRGAPPALLAQPAPTGPTGIAQAAPPPVEAAPILMDQPIAEDAPAKSAHKITTFASGGLGAGMTEHHAYKRHLNRDNKGSLRCRIFHAKLTDAALKFMEDQINDWVDQNPEIEIKSSTTQVGIVEGKTSEPHLIITVFY